MPLSRICGVLAATMAGVCMPTLVHADPLGDFKTGTILYLRTGAISLAGTPSQTGGVKLSKPANTLDFDLDATAVGSPLPITLHLVAVATGSSWIEYQFNETWNGGLPIDGDGDLLYSATGQLVLKLGHSPSDLRAYGNIALDSDPAQPNYMLASGNWGNQVITIDQVSLFGGLLPATLTNFALVGSPETCSDSAPVKVPFLVALDNPAPPGGQIVTLRSANHIGVSLPSQVVVPGGYNSTTFDATVAPSFVGNVELEAKGNGAFELLDLEVDPAHDCQSGSGSGVPVAYNPDSECTTCQYGGINDWGEKIELVDRVVEIIRGSTVQTLASLLPSLAPTMITANAYSDGGYVAGELTASGVTQGYRTNIDHIAGKADLLGTFSPATVNRYGTMVGSMPDPATERSHAAISNGHHSALLPVSNLDAYQSTALFLSDNGEVVGTYIMKLGDVTRGFRMAAKGAATALPEVGTIPGVPVAANAAGQIALDGKDSTGASVAAVVDANNRVTLLGSPSGYTAFHITGMNAAGWIVGTAQSGRITRAFLWQPRSGFRALSGYSRALPTVDNALAITDTFTAVVHATTTGGVTSLYTLPL